MSEITYFDESTAEEFRQRREAVVGPDIAAFKENFSQTYGLNAIGSESEREKKAYQGYQELSETLRKLRAGENLPEDATPIQRQIEQIYTKIETDPILTDLYIPRFRHGWLQEATEEVVGRK